MTSKLSPYNPPTPIQSSLLKKAPDYIPPTNELESLLEELKELKKMTLARHKKAGEDLKAVEDSMRRMKEKEKGKAKAIDRVKRERDYTPALDGDDARSIGSHHAQKSKSRLSSHPVSSLPHSARSSLDPRRPVPDDLKKKKKKRKREFDDSDGEHDLQRPRKSTPPSVPHVPPPLPPVKAQKSVVTSSHTQPKSQAGPDFSIPQPYVLLPPRPPIPPPPTPGPSKPTEVMEDFSKVKQPAQITVNTFYASIEPWIRNIREEDIGFLEHTGDEVEPYIMPALGRHYLDVWEDQDAGLILPIPAVTGDLEAPINFSAPTPKWDPSTLSEGDLVNEERGHGPLTERVISALLPMPDLTVWKGVKAAEDAMEGRPGGSGAAAARRERLNVSDLEARIRDTMRYHGLLDGVPDYSEKVDDPIASALRHAQRELRRVVATNKARRERLVAIARDRLGYQEYLELRDSIDKNITNLYTKLQRKDIPKIAKKKKHKADPTPELNGVPTTPGPCPAALGLITDDDMKLHVNDQLKQLYETRRQWVDAVGSVFDEKQREHPGRIWEFPRESIYQGIEEEVQAMLNRPNQDSSETGPPRTSNNKGKEKELAGDEMDVG